MKLLNSILGVSLIASYGAVSAAMQVDTFSSASTVNSLTIADNLISGATANNGTGTATPTSINHHDGTNSQGNFPSSIAFPGGFTDNFALHATCSLTIPTSGNYTFGTNNDDGLRLTVNGTAVITDDNLHVLTNFFVTLNLSAGIYPLDLVFFERTGGASVELYAKSGTVQTTAGMALIGDTTNGGLACNSILGTTGTITIIGSEAGSPVTVTVTDVDLNTNPGVTETVIVNITNTNTGEIEAATLTETGPNTGVFVGTLATTFSITTGTNNDGVINTQISNTLTASYDDALDASGNDPVAVTATTNIISQISTELVPTLSVWGIFFMSGLLGLMGIFSSKKNYRFFLRY